MGLKSDTFVLQTSGAQTASGTSTTTVDVSAYETGALLVNVSAASGTSPTLVPFLQVSPDNGTTWFGASGAGNPIGSVSNITGTSANYYNVPNYVGGLVRLGWTIGGTTPSFTFAAWLVVRK
jgi:hypothetical protein